MEGVTPLSENEKGSRPLHGLLPDLCLFVRLKVRFCCGLVSVCCNDRSSHQTNCCAEILRRSLGLHLTAPFLRIIAVGIHGTQSSKNRCRTNSHTTRMMVGRYICSCIRLADSLTESLALESSVEYSALALPTCFPNSFSAAS